MTSCGFDSTREAKLSPLLSMRPGLSLSIIRSASLASCRTMCWPSGWSMSIAAPRLPALKYVNWRLNSTCARSSRKGPSRRTGDPPTGSTRMTSAPRSANCLPQYCPANPERSRTRTPASAAGVPLVAASGALQASPLSPIPALIAASYIELVPSAAVATTSDPSQRIDGLMTDTMARHHAFRAVDGNDFANDQMRARSLVPELLRPVQAAFEMHGRLRNARRANQSRWQDMKANFLDFADRTRKALRARLDLSRHALGNRVDDVLLRARCGPYPS